jgi:peptidoglycan/xylan/chitin deacetylase (PgdA/CDA1 family)
MNRDLFNTLVCRLLFGACLLFGFCNLAFATQAWPWPDGKKAALSLTFDDARVSQVKQGTAFLDQYGVKATFYVVPGSMEPELDGWKQAVKNGHEIGNHTVHHPCTGNFDWKRDHALEDYTLASMRNELVEANRQIEEMLGVTVTSYAYTCGQKFVGRGTETRSYIPVVAELFDSGRGFLDETANAPGYLDLAQLTGIESDGKDFDEIKPFLDKAQENGDWVVLAGHEMAAEGGQTTRFSMLEELIAYAQDPANGIWLATVAEVTEYVKMQQQQQPLSQLKEALTFHASFDHGYDADFAKGSPSIYTAPEYGKLEDSQKGMKSGDVAIQEAGGKFGGALQFKKKSKDVLFFRSEDNIAYHRENWSGAISLWMQLDPEKDLEPGYVDPIQITDAGYNDAALWVDFTDKNPRVFRMGVFGDLSVWNPDNIGPDDNPDFNNRLVAATDRPFSNQQWTHVVISFSQLGTAGAKADFYVNGKLQGTQDDIPESFTWDLLKSKIFLGLNYVGLMDEVAIFNKSLSAEEVGWLYGLEKGVGELY